MVVDAAVLVALYVTYPYYAERVEDVLEERRAEASART
jgi:hypothetical protein